MRHFLTALVLTSLMLVLVSAAGATPAKPTKPAGDGSKGVSQMAGGNGKFGVTYTLVDGNGLLINYTILSAAYKIEPFWQAKSATTAPTSDQKVLEVHYKIKNPTSSDEYYNASDYLQVVDPTDQILTSVYGGRNIATDDNASGSLKPGQGIDNIATYVLVPAKGAVSKLIVTLARAGVNEKVLRFPIGTAPNIIAPLPAPYFDPSDPTKVNAAAEIPATFGASYISGCFDLVVSDPKLVDGPLGNHTADAGKKFLTVLIKLTNITERQQYISGDLTSSVTDTDGDSIQPAAINLKPAHDDDFEARMFDAGETATYRYVFQVPSDATLQKLKIATALEGGNSQAFVYDVSAVK